jgi:hypothetical protein
MSLAEQIAAHALTQGPKCPVGRYLAQATTAHRTELAAILDGDNIAHATLSRWFVAQGVKVPASAISAHRARTCSCSAAPIRSRG